MEAHSGSLEPGQPSRARSTNTRHPAGRRHMPPADRSLFLIHFSSHFPGKPELVGFIRTKDNGSGGDN